MIYNRIPIALGGLTKVKGPAINYQYDQKQILILTGLELPDYYTVDFCNDGDQQTKPMVGTADGVEIPDEFLLTGRPVKAYLIVTGEDDGAVETRYEITLPVNQRPARTDITPTPAEQSTIDGLIEAMNQAVTDTEEAAEQAGQAVLHYPKVVNEYWYVWDVTAEDYVNTGYKATGSGTGISDAYLNADYTLTIEFTDGTSYTTPSIRGEPGPVGATPDFDIGTVTTGQPGTPASATITGTAAKPLLNLTIPKGDPGEVTQSEFDTAIGTINSALSSLASVTEIIDTASGAIASFPDGSGLPMRSLVAQINPVQDLHGYANPWPAGGGRNKLNIQDVAQTTRDGLTYRIENGVLYANGTYSGSGFSLVLIHTDMAEGTYTFSAQLLSGSMSGPNSSFNGYNADNNRVWLVAFGTSGATVNMTRTDDIKLIDVAINSGISFVNAAIGFQVEANSSMTTFQPYSNICPISGWQGLSGQRAGRNVLNDSLRLQYNTSILYLGTDKNPNVYPGTQYATHLKPGTYTVSTPGYTSVSIFYARDADGTEFSARPDLTGVLTITKESTYATWIYAPNADVANVGHVQLEVGDTKSDYSPYTGTTIPVSWETEAGTVYGGTLDVVSGDLFANIASVDCETAGFTLYNTEAGRWICGFAGIKRNPNGAVTAGLMAEDYREVTANAYNNIMGTMYLQNNSDRVHICTGSADIRPTGKLIYPLAEPIHYTLTPQEVDTLVGQNNVWVDTGDVSVTYQANLKGYIDKVLGA